MILVAHICVSFFNVQKKFLCRIIKKAGWGVGGAGEVGREEREGKRQTMWACYEEILVNSILLYCVCGS